MADMTNDPELLDLANSWHDHRAGVEKHRTMQAEAAESILLRLGPGDKIEIVPGVGIRVQGASRSFSETKARQVLTPEQLDAITETRPAESYLSDRLAKTLLAPAIYDLCRADRGKPGVREL